MRNAVPFMGLVVVGLCACSEGSAPSGPELSIAVAPLTLPGIERACYDLSVVGEAGPVWTESGVCSDQFGNGRGDIAFVGPCDATDTNGGGAVNTVSLVLTDLYASDAPNAPAIAHGQYENPCDDPNDADYSGSGPCTQQIVCAPNTDQAVSFDLTIMRDAKQGFFDVAVSFDDIFCSAKVDCTTDAAGTQPLELLFNGDERDQTAVVALACTAGPGQSTTLDVDSVTIECGTADDGPPVDPMNVVAISANSIAACDDRFGGESVLTNGIAQSYQLEPFAIIGIRADVLENSWTGSGWATSVVSREGPSGHVWKQVQNLGKQIGGNAFALGADINDAGNGYDAISILVYEHLVSGWRIAQELAIPNDEPLLPTSVDPVTKVMTVLRNDGEPKHAYYYRPTSLSPLAYGPAVTATFPEDTSLCASSFDLLHGLALLQCNQQGQVRDYVVRTTAPSPVGELLPQPITPADCNTFYYAYGYEIVDSTHILGAGSYQCGGFGRTVPMMWSFDGTSWTGSELVDARNATHNDVYVYDVVGPGLFGGATRPMSDFVGMVFRPRGATTDHLTLIDTLGAPLVSTIVYARPTSDAAANVVIATVGVPSETQIVYGTLPSGAGDATITMRPLVPAGTFNRMQVIENLGRGRFVFRVTTEADPSGRLLVATFDSVSGAARLADLVRIDGDGGEGLDALTSYPDMNRARPYPYEDTSGCDRVLATGGYYRAYAPTPGAPQGGTLRALAAASIPLPAGFADFGGGGGGPATTITLDPSILGNAWGATNPDPDQNDPIWQYAVYRGNESLSCDGVPCQKRYWNVAVGFDPSAESCTLKFSATASNGALTNGLTPAVTSYPVIDVEVPLTGAGGGLECAQHPLNGADGAVATHYLKTPTQFCWSFDGTSVTNNCEQ